MSKQVRQVPEENFDEEIITSAPPEDELDEQPVTLKKKESISPTSSVSVEPGKPSKSSSEKSTSTVNKTQAIGDALDAINPLAKPLYDFGRRIVSGFGDDAPKAIAQGLEVAKSSVAPGSVKEYIKTQAHVDFQKYVREKEGMKWYQSFDQDKYIDQYADSFMQDTGRQEESKEIAVRAPEVQKRRLEVEKFAQQQKIEAEQTMRGAVQDFRDIKTVSDVASYIATMGGQAAYQIPLAILTKGASSFLQESAEVYDQQVSNIATDKGITREEVVAQGLDAPAAGQAYALLAASLDAASAGNILKAFKVGVKDGLIKKWAKTAVPEMITEPVQGVLETVGGATGDKVEAAKKAVTDPDRINEALGGLIGGSVGVFAPSPTKTVEEETASVDVTDNESLDQKAEVIQDKVELAEEAVTTGQQDAPVTTPIADDQKTEAAAPTEGTEVAVSETIQEEEIAAPAEPQTEEQQPVESQPETLLAPEEQAPVPTAKDQIDALVESGDLKRDADNRVTIQTEKGGTELKRILEENKIKHKAVDQAAQQEGDLPFTKTVRGPQDVGGIKGVPPWNQFKLNQGPNFERVQVILSDDQVDIYRQGVKAKKHVSQSTKPENQEAIAFANKVNDLAKANRDKNKEVVLDFRPQQKEIAKASTPQEEVKPEEDGTIIPDDGLNAVTNVDDSQRTVEDQPASADIRQPAAGTTGEGRPNDEATPPQVPTKEAEKESPRNTELRKTWLGIKDNPDVSEEIKAGISKEGKEYVPRSLTGVTKKEADAIVDAKGIDESVKMFLDDNLDVHPDVETAIGAALFDKLQKAENYTDAVRVFEKLAFRGTELGQAINAYKLLRGKTMAFMVDKSLKKARKAFKEKNKWRGQDAKKAVDKANNDAIEKVLKSDKVKKKITSEVKKGNINKAIDFLESLKIDTKGKALDVTFGVTAAAWNTVITAVQKGLQAGLTISQAINKALNQVKDPALQKQEAATFLDEKLKDYRVSLDPGRAIKEELKSSGQKIDDVVRQHYSQQASTKASLIEKLIKDGNVPADQAQGIADELAAEFDRLTKAAKEKALKGLLPKGDKKVTPKQKKDLIDKLIEQSNMGALSEEQYNEAIATELGVPPLDAKQLEEIQKLTDRIQSAKGESQRSKAAQDLMTYIKNLKGWNWLEALESIWYANMLSGATTLLNVNPFANLTNLMMEASIDMAKNPAQAPFILGRIVTGLHKGWTYAEDVIKTGYSPYKGEDYKVEGKQLLERITFKGGKLNPYNYLKYVTRIMKAGDILFFHGAKELRTAVLASKDKAVKSAIAKEDFDNAKSQAAAEGFKGREQKIRAFEIMEQTRPEYVVKEAENFAARGTFNYKPEGTLGLVANWLNNGKRSVPGLNQIVPFVNTIINVTNEYLNYVPIFGGYRALKGTAGFDFQMYHDGKAYRKLTREERVRIGIKAMIGTTAMAALFLLDDPDDEDGFFEVTANGTGDVRKNDQLERSGWRSYSFRVGKTWYNYKNTPLAFPMAIVGYFKDAHRYRKDPDLVEKMGIMLGGSFKMLMDMSTLSGLSDFFAIFSKENISEYESSMTKVMKGLEKTAKTVAIPNIFTQLSRLIQEFTDSPIKRADDIGDALYRDMPVLRDNLGNLYDAFGDPVVAKQLEKLIPLNTHRTPEDAAMFEFLKNNNLLVGAPGKTNRKPNGEEMTEEEYSQFALESARQIKKRLLQEYKIFSRVKNKEEINDWFNDIKEEERRNAKQNLFGYF